MTDLSSHPDPNGDSSDDARERSGQRSPPRTPRWVKVFGIIIIVLVLLVSIILVTGIGGEHGPGRHTPPIEQGVQQP